MTFSLFNSVDAHIFPVEYTTLHQALLMMLWTRRVFSLNIQFVGSG
jgi:hypothetical protein